MAAIAFPKIAPSARSYNPGSYPIEEFQGQNGAVTAVKFANRKKDSELTMTFQNITDADAFLIWKNHQDVMGGLDSNGDWNYIGVDHDSMLDGTIGGNFGVGIADDSMRWVTTEKKLNRRYRYAEPPQFVSTFPGRCTVTVKLRGYLDGPLNG
jgi:hypothetical protein